MGEIADLMLNGELCQICGVYLGEETGYPRYCSNCKPKSSHKEKRQNDKIRTGKSMRTKDIKVGGKYLFQGEEVTVVKRIRGRETNKGNISNGIFEYRHEQKSFLLSNGMQVKANKLEKI